MVDAFKQMSGNGRVVALSVVAVLVVAGLMMARTAANPNRVVLFQGLDLAASGTMSDALTKAGIEHKLEEAGGAISVAETDAARARVTLAQQGMPGSARPGLELFDKPTWGMTDFTQHVTYRRALEGELARTIGTLRGVERAQVHLALPESSALRKLDAPAQAAVVVALQQGLSLTAEQVRGIAQLVSSSVEQLAPENVAVLDDSGRPLVGVPAAEDVAGLSSRQLELQRGVETHLQGKVQNLLDAALGADAVRVQVAARLNFDQVERTIEAYDTAGAVLKAEQRSQTRGDSAAGGAGATVESNEYVNSRTVERIIGSVGGVTRLTVSALVDSRRNGAGGEMLEADRTQLEGIIRDAIGFDESRGDRVSVMSIAFNGITVPGPLIETGDELAAPTGPGALEMVTRLAFPVLALLALVAAALIGWRAVRAIGVVNQAALAGGSSPGEFGRTGGRGSLGDAGADHLPAPQTSARVLRSWLTEST